MVLLAMLVMMLSVVRFLVASTTTELCRSEAVICHLNMCC